MQIMLGPQWDLMIIIPKYFNYMANLQSTTIYGINDSTSILLDDASVTTEWYKVSITSVPSATKVHIRTPWPTDSSAGMTWNPYMIEVVGYSLFQTNSHAFDLKAVINTNDANGWYGSQIKVNSFTYGSTYTDPFFYRSSSTYGGYTRVCFSFNQQSGDPGYIWFKVWTNSGFRTSYAWGQTTNSAQTGAF